MAAIFVRALHDFAGENEGDLPLTSGGIFRVLERDDSGWWTGQGIEGGKTGEFPYNYVEVITKDDVEHYISLSKLGKPQVPRHTGISRVKVKNVEKTLKFKVSVFTGKKEISGTKTIVDFRVLDKFIRSILPDFDCPLPPMWADNAFINQMTTNGRAMAMELYCFKLTKLSSDVADFALLSWLNPKASIGFSEAVKNQVINAGFFEAISRNSYSGAMLNVYPLARAAYDYQSQDPLELSMKAGEVIAIRSRDTISNGWWEAETADLRFGLVPSTHIKMLTAAEAKAFVLGEKVVRQSKPAVVKAKRNTLLREKKVKHNWCVSNLDTFDDLLNYGYAMMSGDTYFNQQQNGKHPQEGDHVSLNYIGYVWNCQKETLAEFSSSDLPHHGREPTPMEFTVGSRKVIAGLEHAVQRMSEGQEARVIISPAWGYGEVGSPPDIAPNCHLVYDLTLIAVSAGALPGPPQHNSVANKTSEDLVDGFLSPTFNMTTQKRDTLKAPGKPQTLAEAVALRAQKLERQESNGGFGYAAPVAQRDHRRQNNAVDDHGLTAPADDDYVDVNRKYDLIKMQEIVRLKTYRQHGVNRSFPEGQLTDEAFQMTFQMSRAAFSQLPQWRQKKMKVNAHIW